MEDAQSHPIPQDVTGFQFKIIGDMTIKQFAYLMGSVFLGWVFYQLPIITLIKLPLALGIGGLGPALAFLPIEGRPMDLMILNFIKAFFQPTRFVYQKTGGNVWLSTVTSQKTAVLKEKVQTPRLNEPLKSSLQATIISQNNKLNEKGSSASLPKHQEPTSPISSENLPLPKTENPPPISQQHPSPLRIISMFTPHIDRQSVFKKPESLPLKKIQNDKNEALEKKVLALEKDLELMRKEKIELERKQLGTTSPQQQESMGIEKQLQGVIVQKEELTKQLIALQQKLDLQKKNVFAPTMATAKSGSQTFSDLAKTQNVKQIPKGMGKNIGLPITPEFPNIITGILKDPRGNPLGNILVEVKDKEGNPVRAFKTNGLGQFISATALANGEYTILFEDPKGQNKFDAIGFEAIGEVILPIEVTSIDEREELRKSLFRES